MGLTGVAQIFVLLLRLLAFSKVCVLLFSIGQRACKGWKLPTGGTNGQFNTLMTNAGIYTTLSGSNTTSRQRGSVKAQALPYKLHYAGGVNDGAPNGETAYGFWWSRMVNDADRTYSLFIKAIEVNPVYNIGRYCGFSLRCITTPTS